MASLATLSEWLDVAGDIYLAVKLCCVVTAILLDIVTESYRYYILAKLVVWTLNSRKCLYCFTHPFGMTQKNFFKIFVVRNVGSLSYRAMLVMFAILTKLWLSLDEQTDGWTRNRYRASIAPRMSGVTLATPSLEVFVNRKLVLAMINLCTTF